MSNNSGLLFLNKAIQSEDFNVFARYGIRDESFVSDADRKTYDFIKQYHEDNGEMPSYAMVADSVPEFTYVPDITDKFEPLARGINNRKLGIEFNEFFNGGKFQEIQEESGGNVETVIQEMNRGLESMRAKYANQRRVGRDLKKGADYYKEEYEKRKAGESAKTWESFMPYFNEEAGGYTAGNMYVFYGRSGRGKSAIVLREALNMAIQGATVLLWSLEMPAYEVMTRLYAQLSAVLEKTSVMINTEMVTAGYDSRMMRNGEMTDELEKDMFDMLSHINDHIEGNIVIRGVDDRDFSKRDVDQLNSDIQSTGADVAIVDPMYYMDYEKNESQTSGGAAAATSVKLRRLAGSQEIVLMALTQAEEDENQSDSEVRELKLPQRKEVKKTKALLEDAAVLVAIDTDYKQSRGILGIQKGRNGGEGSTTELTYLPNYGLIEQLVFDTEEFSVF